MVPGWCVVDATAHVRRASALRFIAEGSMKRIQSLLFILVVLALTVPASAQTKAASKSRPGGKPATAASAPAGAATPKSTASATIVDLNSASKADLQTLPGI